MIRKNLRLSVLFLIIAVLSIWAVTAVSKNFSFASLVYELAHAKVQWIILAFALMPGFIVFEGMALSKLVEGVCGVKSHWNGIIYSAADIYFSAITPSASGGQPASAFFMHADGISAAQTTVILIVNLILYCYSLLLSGFLAIPMGGWVFSRMDTGAQVLIVAGFGLIILLSVGFWLLLRRERIILAIGNFAIWLGEKLHLIKNPEGQRRRIRFIASQYAECARQMQGKGRFILWAFIYNMLQRMCQSLITVCCYLAVGGRISRLLQVWAVQLMANLGAYTIPIPGGMGVADYLLISGLERVPDMINDTNMTLISRGISFYSSVLLSVIIISVAYAIRKTRKNDGKRA